MRLVRPSPPNPVWGRSCCLIPVSALMTLRGRRSASGHALPLPIKPISNSSEPTQSLGSSTQFPVTPILKTQCFRPSPELGLLSLLFVLSMAIGAIFSLAIMSFPTINAFTKLVASIHKFSRVVYEEVPTTMSSLRLSVLEINQLTHQLSILRQRIYATARQQSGNKVTSNYPSADKD